MYRARRSRNRLGTRDEHNGRVLVRFGELIFYLSAYDALCNGRSRYMKRDPPYMSVYTVPRLNEKEGNNKENVRPNDVLNVIIMY